MKILVAHGFDQARRTPMSGAGFIKGDLTSLSGGCAIPGIHIEVKRQERLNYPAAIRQAHADSGVNVPVLVSRCSRTTRFDPVGLWHATLPLTDLLALLANQRTGRIVHGDDVEAA